MPLGSLDVAEREAREAREALAAAAQRVAALQSGTDLPEPTRLPPPPLQSEVEEGGRAAFEDGAGAAAADDDGEKEEKLKAPPNDPFADGMEVYFKRMFRELLFTSQLNWLLICTPFAFVGHYAGWPDRWVFFLSLGAIAPFAERLSYVTEQLALHTSETLGGLLNATFGNVTELIVSLLALQAGLYRIVQVSLLGSILSNLLLVLGTAFLVGGLKHPEQRYNRTAQTASFSLLLLATMGLLYPMILSSTHETLDDTSVLLISRLTSCAMLATYGFYLAFQLYTHTHIFEDGDDNDDDDDDEEERILGASGAIAWLGIISVFIAFLSEYMVDAITGAAEELRVPDLFLGTIVLPIVGNAAEHAAAIIFAHKNKMELALGIAVGSATQIAIFVVPLCVIIAWFVDAPLDLNFHPFETATLVLTVVLVGVIIQTGESHWLAGQILVTAYLILCICYGFHVDLPTVSPPPPAA